MDSINYESKIILKAYTCTKYVQNLKKKNNYSLSHTVKQLFAWYLHCVNFYMNQLEVGGLRLMRGCVQAQSKCYSILYRDKYACMLASMWGPRTNPSQMLTDGYNGYMTFLKASIKPCLLVTKLFWL